MAEEKRSRAPNVPSLRLISTLVLSMVDREVNGRDRKSFLHAEAMHAADALRLHLDSPTPLSPIGRACAEILLHVNNHASSIIQEATRYRRRVTKSNRSLVKFGITVSNLEKKSAIYACALKLLWLAGLPLAGVVLYGVMLASGIPIFDNSAVGDSRISVIVCIVAFTAIGYALRQRNIEHRFSKQAKKHAEELQRFNAEHREFVTQQYESLRKSVQKAFRFLDDVDASDLEGDVDDFVNLIVGMTT